MTAGDEEFAPPGPQGKPPVKFNPQPQPQPQPKPTIAPNPQPQPKPPVVNTPQGQPQPSAARLKATFETKCLGGPPSSGQNAEPSFYTDGPVEWQGVLTSFKRDDLTAKQLTDWYKSMETDLDKSTSNLAVLFVPNPGSQKPISGTVYLSSGTVGQEDDAVTRLAKRPKGKQLHPLLAEALKGAVAAAAKENPGASVAEKDEGGKPAVLGHTTCFSCPETVVLNWFLHSRVSKDFDYQEYKPGWLFVEMPRLYVLGRKNNAGKTVGGTENPVVSIKPCSNVMDVQKARKESTSTGPTTTGKYPNVSTAGCKHFLDAFGIGNMGLET